MRDGLRVTVGLAGALALALAMGAAGAAVVDLHVRVKPTPDVERDIPLGERGGRFDVAVIVGNRNYAEEGVPDVAYAHEDLATLKKYLIRTLGFPPGNVIEERDATKGTFETLFGSRARPYGKLHRYVRPGRSRVFVYYVGHGAPDPESGEGYFVPVDADPDYIANAGYPLSTLYANLNALPAKEVVVVLDACFSGRTQDGVLFENISPGMLRVTETPADLSSGAVLTSSQGDQLSTWYPAKRHSLFTYFFLRGLRGEADRDGDRAITAGEMGAYLGEEVPYWAGRLTDRTQKPRLQGKEDIVLVRPR